MKLITIRDVEVRKLSLINKDKRLIQLYIKNGCVGDLDLWGTPLDSLPDNLTHIGGHLLIPFSKIKTLNVKFVDGSLVAQDSKIEKLPDNLTINGDLGLTNCPIKKLPNNLKIKNYCYIII